MPKGDRQKRVFVTLIVIFIWFLMALPVLVTVNEGLTRVVEKVTLYKFIQDTIVPFELRTVGVVLTVFGMPVQLQHDGLTVAGRFLRFGWNCVGWQSLVFLVISFVVGFGNNYTKRSVVEAVLLGILGTYLVNLLRILIIVGLGVYAPGIFVWVFHDYLAVGMTVVWMWGYWWFVYKFLLEPSSK